MLAPPSLSALHLLEDAALVDRVRADSPRVFQILVERHQAPLRAWLARIAPPGQADDIAQEAFVKAWQALGRWDRRGSFRSWLFGIARHVAADARRAGARAVARDSRWAADQDPPPASPAQALDASLDVDRILAGLPEPQRQVLALCYGAGFSHQEAADTLGLPLGTVKSHVARGRDAALAVMRPIEPLTAPRRLA
jgi:RNA polymerase sigma-70 factor (ECF subfamily)